MSRILDDIKQGKGLDPLFYENSESNAMQPDASHRTIYKTEYIITSSIFARKEELENVRKSFIDQLKEDCVVIVPCGYDVKVIKKPIAYIGKAGDIISLL